MVRASGLQWFNEISVSPTGGRVLLGGYPWPAAIARGLANREKVEVVINTVAEREDKCFGDSVKVVRVPMRDFAEPSAKDVLACVAELDEAFKQGKTVYDHCKAGKGRSATVVLCWLVVRRGMSVEDAQALLSTRRPQVLKSLATRKVVREIVR